jgi:hypothetical protein
VALDSGTLRAMTAATPSLLFQPRALRRLLAVPPRRRTPQDVEDIADFTCWLAPLRGVPEALRKSFSAHAEIRHVPAGATLGNDKIENGGGNGGAWVDGEELAVVVSGQLAVHDSNPVSIRADQGQDPAGAAGRQTPNSIRGDQTRSLSFLKEWTDPAAGDAMLHGIRSRRGGAGGGKSKFKSLAKTVNMLAKLRGSRKSMSMMGGDGSGTPGGTPSGTPGDESSDGTGPGEVVSLSSPRKSSVRASPRESDDVEGAGAGEGGGDGAGGGGGGRRLSRPSRLTRTSLASPPSQPDFNYGEGASEGAGDGGSATRHPRQSITSLVSVSSQLDFDSDPATASGIGTAAGDLSVPLEAVTALAALQPRRYAAKVNAQVEAAGSGAGAGAGAGRGPGDGGDEERPEGPAAATRLLQVGALHLETRVDSV